MQISTNQMRFEAFKRQFKPFEPDSKHLNAYSDIEKVF